MPYRQESVLKLRTPFEHLLLEILLFYVVHLSHIKSIVICGAKTAVPSFLSYLNIPSVGVVLEGEPGISHCVIKCSANLPSATTAATDI